MCVRIKIVSVQGVCQPTVRNVTVADGSVDEDGVPPPRYEDVTTIQPRPQPLAQCQYNRQYFYAVCVTRGQIENNLMDPQRHSNWLNFEGKGKRTSER